MGPFLFYNSKFLIIVNPILNWPSDHFENVFLIERQVHNYYIRNTNEFYIATPRTNLRQFWFEYQRSLLYNNLNRNTMNSVSYLSITKRMKKHPCHSYTGKFSNIINIVHLTIIELNLIYKVHGLIHIISEVVCYQTFSLHRYRFCFH